MPFLYPELNLSASEIRVLDLAPAADEDDEICCTLKTVTLNEELVYEALSYVWGDEPPSHEIFINSEPFQVRPNLFVALQRMRDASRSRTLWIDAICIWECYPY